MQNEKFALLQKEDDCKSAYTGKIASPQVDNNSTNGLNSEIIPALQSGNHLTHALDEMIVSMQEGNHVIPATYERKRSEQKKIEFTLDLLKKIGSRREKNSLWERML